MNSIADATLSWLLLVLGLIALVGGAEGLVRGSVAIARRLGISPLLIGLTVVGFGTSTPELTASVSAALKESPGIAVGNVVGSNIANILLILGVSALIAPIATTKSAFLRDGTALIIASLILAVVCAIGSLNRGVGLALLVLLAGYVYLSFRLDRAKADAASVVHREQAEAISFQPTKLWTSILWTLGGLVALIVGASLLVNGAITIARTMGISETVIGLTIVAVGTSLPELATSVVAGLRGQSDVAFGNVIGSNIFNILGILGVTSVVRPLAVPSQIIQFDIWVMLAATGIAVLFSISGWRISRWEGLVLLCGYAAYVGILFWPSGRAFFGLS